jgi:hypothetical protein
MASSLPTLLLALSAGLAIGTTATLVLSPTPSSSSNRKSNDKTGFQRNKGLPATVGDGTVLRRETTIGKLSRQYYGCLE